MKRRNRLPWAPDLRRRMMIFALLVSALLAWLPAADDAPVPPAPPVPLGPPTPAPASPASTASDSWWVSRTGGFKLQFPRGWFFGPGPAPADCTGYAPNDMYGNGPFTSFAVVARMLSAPDLAADDQAIEMLKLGQESLKASLPGYQWRDAGEIKVPGGAGRFLIYNCQLDGRALAGVVYYLVRGKQQFVCHGRCLTPQLEAVRPVFDRLVQSLQPNGAPQPAWAPLDNGAVFRQADLHCTLALPAGFQPEQAGSVTIFRATSANPEAPAPPGVPAAAQLSFSQEPLPAPLQWVVYLETVKRQLRDRLSDYRPGSVTVFNYLIGQDTPTEAEGERQFFEYTHKLDGRSVKVGSLFWLRGQQVLVLTVSAPEADYQAAKENLFMPAAKSWTWDLAEKRK